MSDEFEAALRRADQKLEGLKAALVQRGALLRSLRTRAATFEKRRQQAQQARNTELGFRPALSRKLRDAAAQAALDRRRRRAHVAGLVAKRRTLEATPAPADSTGRPR